MKRARPGCVVLVVVLAACTGGDGGESEAGGGMSRTGGSAPVDEEPSSGTPPSPTSGDGSGASSISATGSPTSASASNDGSTSSSESGSGSGGDTGDGDPVELRNTSVTYDSCNDPTYVSIDVLPASGTEWSATRLTPPTYPFEVREVRYALDGTVNECDASLAHRVMLFAGGAVPPSTPSADRRTAFANVPENPGAGASAEWQIDISSPIVLDEGESLYVAIEMVAPTASAKLCVAACYVDGGIPGVDFWAEDPEEPLTWPDLVADWGSAYNFTTTAVGVAL